MAIFAGNISGSSLTGSVNYTSLVSVPSGIVSSSAQVVAGVAGQTIAPSTINATGAISGSSLTVNNTITSTLGTTTTSTPFISSSATWSGSAVTFVHDFVNITDTASSGSSLLADWQVGSTSKFSVRKDGSIFTNGAAAYASAIGVVGSAGTMFNYSAGNAAVFFRAGGTTAVSIYLAGGTQASPSAATSGLTATYRMGAYDGSTTAVGAYVAGLTTQTWSSTAHGMKLNFAVTPSGSTGNQVAMVIDQDSSVIIGTDPGGSQLLRVGGGANFNGLVDIQPNALFPSMRLVGASGGSKQSVIQYNGTNASSTSVTWYAGVNAVSTNGSFDIFESNNTYGIKISPTDGTVTTQILVVGTDPGGSQLLRVGGSAIIGSTLTVASGSQTTVDIQATLAGGTARLKLNPTSNNYYTIETAGSTDALQFIRGSSELMRIDSSGNAIIADTATQYSSKLYVNGSIAARNGGVDGTYADAFVAGYTGNYNEKNIIQSSVSSVGTNSGFRFKVSDGGGLATTTTSLDLTKSQILLYTAGSERMRIDSSGNVGIGITPSAWSLGKAIEVNNAGNALWGVAASEINVSQNAYYNGGWKYAATSSATRYEQNTGVHRWWVASSGTAGTAITFTTGMTLDTNSILTINGASGDGRIQYTNTARDSSTGLWVGVDSGQSYILSRSTYPLTFFTNATERMRIDSSGNVGIGTTSPIYTAANRGNLTINGSSDAILVLTNGSNINSYGYLYYDGTNTALASSGALLFKPASTERMRIDTSGNVGINATPSGTYKLEVNGTLGVSGTISGTGTNTWALQSVGAAGSLVAGGWLYGVNNGLNFAPNGAGLVKRLTLSYYDTVNGVYHEALGYSNTTSAAGAVSLIPDGGSVTIGGTLGVTGATTLTGGTASNRGNTGSIASGVATTMFSVSGTNGLYLVVAYINNSGAPDYQASALVTVGGTASNVNITAQNGAAMVISASGTNIRVTQTAGSSQTVQWAYQLIA